MTAKTKSIHPEALTGWEFEFILTQWGYKKTEFCTFISRSKDTGTRFFSGDDIVPFRFNKKLEEFLGTEDYKIALKMVEERRKEEEERKKPYKTISQGEKKP